MAGLDSIDEKMNLASSTMASGDFENGAKYCREVIAILEQAKVDDPDGLGGATAADHLGIAYFDLAGCLIRTGGAKINDGVHALFSALMFGFIDPSLSQNLLYCIDIANKFLAARIVHLEDNESNRELARWLNKGYDFLKTPCPPGTPGRNWEGAAFAYQRAILINSTLASAYHGLGLAYEGMNDEALNQDAISAWIDAKRFDPEYNFEYRCRYRLK